MDDAEAMSLKPVCAAAAPVKTATRKGRTAAPISRRSAVRRVGGCLPNAVPAKTYAREASRRSELPPSRPPRHASSPVADGRQPVSESFVGRRGERNATDLASVPPARLGQLADRSRSGFDRITFWAINAPERSRRCAAGRAFLRDIVPAVHRGAEKNLSGRGLQAFLKAPVHRRQRPRGSGAV